MVQSTPISFCPISDNDLPFLKKVYHSTRADELACLGWSNRQITDFINMQFDAQHRQYLEHYVDARFEIIHYHGKKAGRLYRDEWSDEVRIIDIALLPEYRNLGIGTAILEDILHDAAQKHLPVSIHVERMNPALSLYRRKGFREIEDKGVYLLLACDPGKRTTNHQQRRNERDDGIQTVGFQANSES